MTFRSDEQAQQRLFRNLSLIQKLTLITTVVSSGITVWVVYLSGHLDLTYLSLILTITVMFFFDRLARFHFENSAMKKIADLNPNLANLRYIGTGSAGVEWFCRNHSGLTRGYNTIYRPVYALGSAELMDQYDDAIRYSISHNNCEWRDLCYSETDVDYAHKMFQSLSMPETAKRRRYHAAKLNIDAPILQMMILYYGQETGEDRSSVMLGWTFKGANRAAVFVCENSGDATTSYFQNYFDELYNKYSTPIYEPTVPTPQLPAAPHPPSSAPAGQGRRRWWFTGAHRP